jgi:hypothetical protein
VKFGALDAATPPEVYLPHAQHPVPDLTIAVRGSGGDPMSLVPTARTSLGRMDRELPMADIRTMNDLVGRSIAERRFVMLLIGTFATLRCCSPPSASTACSPTWSRSGCRRSACGSRLARRRPTSCACSCAKARCSRSSARLRPGRRVAAAQALNSLLFGVRATDPSTFAGVAVALAIVAFVASYVPARRAARVDPMTALRTD